MANDNNEINVGALSEAINEKMDRDLVNADTIGQALLDKKVEVEALLEQNGYAKFTWKENNKVASLVIQWYQGKISGLTTVTLPVSFSNTTWVGSCAYLNTTDTSATSARANSFNERTINSFKTIATEERCFICVGY